MKVDREHVITLISEVLGDKPDNLTNDKLMAGHLDADSLDCCEIVLRIGETFGIAITDDEAEKATTIGQVVALVIEKAKAA